MNSDDSSTTADGLRLLLGKCECGDVRYQVTDAFEYALNCHCSACRRATGSAFKAFAGIKVEHLRFIGGDGALVYGEEGESNTRCARCGSLLFSVVREGKYVHVALGSLVDDPSVRPTDNIWVSDKAPWFEITDGLPQFDELPI